MDELGLQASVTVCSSDFERGIINAAAAMFDTTHEGCHFHLSQSIWRQVQHSGLSANYNQDENFAIAIRKLGALAFSPVDEVRALFLELDQVKPREAAPVYNFVREYYIDGFRWWAGSTSICDVPACDMKLP